MSERKIAVVTGASSGIGAVYADRLAQRGYDLLLVARRQDRLDGVAEAAAEKHGVIVKTLLADLAREDDVAKVEQILATNPAVHVLVNNAGTARMTSVQKTTAAEAHAQIALNITALTRLTQAVLPAFLARNDGVIINIASVLSIKALTISAIYSGTKGYVSNFTLGLQDELVGTGVKVQLVNPATTATEIWDVGGVPLSGLDPAMVMTAEHLVDAALAGLDMGEKVSWPSLGDLSAWEAYEDARGKLFAATRSGTPAARYNIA